MWVVAIVYLVYTICKIVMFIKSRSQAKKQSRCMLEVVDIFENVSIFFTLFFVAMECIGIGLYISLIVTCLCHYFSKKTRCETTSTK